MPERDYLWSIFLHYHYGQHSAVDRLVEWAWLGGDKSHINDESIRLCAIALTWFLTTSNRFLRDRATKALVSILTPRIHLLNQLIHQLLDVNDLYILERLFAVAYGCVMRSTNDIEISKLAHNVYHWIFENGETIPHILLRDYARGVIELAVSRRINLNIDIEKIKPPYRSDWLINIPSVEDLEQILTNSNNRVLRELRDSIMGFGDFSRYIIGTNSNFFDWTSRSLEESINPTYKEIYESFLDSLTSPQKTAWDKYQKILEVIEHYNRLNTKERLEIWKQEFTEEEIEEEINNAKTRFIRTLGKEKLEIYEKSIILYLKNPNIDKHNFDLTIAQRWIFRRVFEIGYNVDYFGDFDYHLSSHGREQEKPERIGKKYQWLAYHEFLARVSDHFEFKGDDWCINDENGYDGTWQISVRDIDPSCLLKVTKSDSTNDLSWWSHDYNNWDLISDEMEWLERSDDLPNPKLFIDIIRPKENSRWLALENSIRLNKKLHTDSNNSRSQQRQIIYRIHSYLVYKEDMDDLYQWAVQQNFLHDWMPRSHEQMGFFVGEFCWSSAFEYHNIPYFSHYGWTQGNDDRIPRKVLVSTDIYWKETGYDCSIDESYSIYLPCQWLVDEMNLRWNGVEGHFYNEHGELIIFDLSINDSGAKVCLINRNSLLSFLDKNNYDILWTIEIEKHILDEISYPYRTFSGAFRIKNGELEGEIKMYS